MLTSVEHSGSVFSSSNMHRRTRKTLWIVAAVLIVLAAAIFLRFKAPPEAARLLPESDGIVYVNLRPLRAFMKQNVKPISHAPEYQAFIDATGIDWERDLEEAAVSLHRMSDPRGPNGPVAYSMVLVGKLDGKALTTFEYSAKEHLLWIHFTNDVTPRELAVQY